MASTAAAGLLFPIRYWEQIVENSKNADPVLVKALIRQESAFNTAAKSRVKASGLMQLMYTTARIFGIKQRQQLLDPNENIRAGSDFLAQLIKKFGSVELALAAYNAGPNAVAQWQKRYPTENIDLFVEMIPYTETREYVRLVNRNYKIYQHLLTKPTFLGAK
ncbi:Soluble lytic murein transglycosylase precursor [compost metagenome]